MDDKTILKLLSGETKDLNNLRDNIEIVKEFLILVNRIDSLPETSRRLYEESRSLFQVVSKGVPAQKIEQDFIAFFGAHLKRAGEPVTLKMKFNPSVKYIGELRPEQAFFSRKIKGGEFYGAIWPWVRKPEYLTLHLGYYSKTLNDEDFHKLEDLVRKSAHQRMVEEMEAGIGGQIHGISLPAFLQMSEMEKTTCTLKVKSGHKTGWLYLNDGKLIDGKTDEFEGKDAAYRVISWDNVVIEIDKASRRQKNVINEPLMHILMESLKIKDEEDFQKTMTKPPVFDAEPVEEVKEEEEEEEKEEKEFKEKKKEAIQEFQKIRVKEAGIIQSWLKDPHKKRILKLSYLSIAAVLILYICATFTFKWISSSRAKNHYESVLQNVEKETEIKQKEILLSDFINAHGSNIYTEEAKVKLKEIRAVRDENLYREITGKVQSLPIEFDYDKKAINLYKIYLAQFPDGKYTAKIKEQISLIPELIDDTQFNHIITFEWPNEEEKTIALKEYLIVHPNGKHRDQAEAFLVKIIENSYLSIKEELAKCEEKNEWNSCLDKCSKFLATFDNTYRTDEIRKIKSSIQSKQDLADLKKKAEEKGKDFAAVKNIYSEYLDKNPDSPVKSIIEEKIASIEKNIKEQKDWEEILSFTKKQSDDLEKKIEKLDKYIDQNRSGEFYEEARSLLEALQKEKAGSERKKKMEMAQEQKEESIRNQMMQRQQQQAFLDKEIARVGAKLNTLSSRYANNGNGTFTDKKSGLMWCILDSSIVFGNCLNYKSAVQYVAGITTGGYSDWRLPTLSELAGIYKHQPYFPASGASWFWSSEIYVKGYYEMVGIVTSKQENEFRSEYVTTKECGAVHAVRP